MGYFADLLSDTNQTLAVPVHLTLLDAGQASRLRREAASNFFPEKEGPVWDFAENRAPSAHGEEKRLWMGEFEPDAAHYLFFKPNDEASAFLFPTGSDLTRLLGECQRFECWVCDQPMTYLFCFNHHSYLMAWGTAAHWLSRRAQKT